MLRSQRAARKTRLRASPGSTVLGPHKYVAKAPLAQIATQPRAGVTRTTVALTSQLAIGRSPLCVVSPTPGVTVDGPEFAEPVRVRLHQGANHVVAVELVTGIFGVGATAREAIADFRQALSEHAAVLASGQLAPQLERQRRFLQYHLKDAARS